MPQSSAILGQDEPPIDLRRVIDHMDAFVGVLDRDATLLEANEAAIAITGLAREDVIGKKFWDCYWWSYDETVISDLKNAFSRACDGELVRYDVTIRTKDEGRMIIDFMLQPVRDEHGVIEHVIPSGFDVTDRKRLEETVADNERRLRLAMEVSHIGSWEWDLATNQTIWDNAQFEMFGIPVGTAVTLDLVYSVIHPDDLDAVRELNRLSVERGVEYKQEFRVVMPDGRVRWLAGRGNVVRNKKGIPIRMIGVNWDITERKEFEQSLERSRRIAEAANQSRGEFLANMSHEIRTPMTAILGYADLLSGHLTDPDNLQCVETIRRNGKYLLEIINDILDLSKIDAGKLEVESERVRPDLLIGDIRSLMDVRAKEKLISLDVEFDGKIPAVIETDAVRLRQILLNLLGNAIKFTDDGSVRLLVRYDATENEMHFDIVDTGIGIESDEIESLFDAFKQADSSSTRAHGGTGLGLTISRRLARILGGDISVTSQLNFGSVFTLKIKCGNVSEVEMIEPNLNVEVTLDASDPSWEINGRVLVVDDRRDIRFLAQHFIEKAGGRVIVASNGAEAIEILTASDDDAGVDLVLMDMQMPVMDGYAAASRLRELGFTRPIVALTAHAMNSDRDKCLAAGCTDYTTKPLHGPNLVQIIAKNIAKYSG